MRQYVAVSVALLYNFMACGQIAEEPGSRMPPQLPPELRYVPSVHPALPDLDTATGCSLKCHLHQYDAASPLPSPTPTRITVGGTPAGAGWRSVAGFDFAKGTVIPAELSWLLPLQDTGDKVTEQTVTKIRLSGQGFYNLDAQKPCMTPDARRGDLVKEASASACVVPQLSLRLIDSDGRLVFEQLQPMSVPAPAFTLASQDGTSYALAAPSKTGWLLLRLGVEGTVGVVVEKVEVGVVAMVWD